MGEYAIYHGDKVKIGTCEELFYLRWDQAHLVTAIHGSLNPLSKAARRHCLYRFPWPDEDALTPGSGEYGGGWRGMVVHGVDAPAELDHGTCQFTSRNGYLLNLPCPEQGTRWDNRMGIDLPLPLTPTAKGLREVPPETLPTEVADAIQIITEPVKLRVGLNGYGGSMALVGQRWWEGRLVAVGECKGCGRIYRMPAIEDAEPMLVGLRSMADREERTADQNGTEGNRAIARRLHEIADRAAAGYTMKEDTHDDR